MSPGDRPSSVEIALCDTIVAARTASSEWSSATIVALVPTRDDGTATIAALDAGAHVCIRGTESVLIAAYLQSIANRRGLDTEGLQP